MRKIVDKLIKEISENRAKILEDFSKAYLASRWEDYFSKQKKIDFRRIELVEQRTADGYIWFFRLKRGVLKSIIR